MPSPSGGGPCPVLAGGAGPPRGMNAHGPARPRSPARPGRAAAGIVRFNRAGSPRGTAAGRGRRPFSARPALWPGAAVADGVPLEAGDGHAHLGTRAGGRGGGQFPGQARVEQAEALDLARPLRQAKQRSQRNDQVCGPRLECQARRGGAGPRAGINRARTAAVRLVRRVASAPAAASVSGVVPRLSLSPGRPGLGPGQGLGGVGRIVRGLGVRDPCVRRHAVQQVEVRLRAQHVHPGIAERIRVLVLLGAGVHARHRGEGLVRWQVTSREARRARQLAEEGHPGVSPLRLLAPPLGQAGVDRQRGLLGEPQHLREGLTCQLAKDQLLSHGGVGVRQVLERLGDGAPCAPSPANSASRGSRAGGAPLRRPGPRSGHSPVPSPGPGCRSIAISVR